MELQKPVRHAAVSLQYNSLDITADVAPFLTSFSFSDVMNGKYTDDIAVTLEDKDGMWQDKWFPEHGATLAASLTCLDWPGGAVLNCGTFEVDDIQFAGPPHSCTVSAVAIGIQSSIRREVHTRTWESSTLQEIAKEIAGTHGFELVFDSTVNPTLDRYDQREISDMAALTELCDANGLGIKLSDKKIFLFESKLYDAQAPAITLRRGKDGYIRHNFRLPTTDLYAACQVEYVEPHSKHIISYLWEPPASEWSNKVPRSGYILRVNERCKCEADAQRLAKARLRQENSREVTGSITYMGRVDIPAGEVAAIEGWGKLDQANYFIDAVRHKYTKSGGYETTVELRGRMAY